MNMLYRIFAVLALVVAYVSAEAILATDETIITAEKHIVSFNNKSVPSSANSRDAI